MNWGTGYACRCMLGFDGSLCELQADECGSRPCANRAACTGLLAGATCHCPLGFKGTSVIREVVCPVRLRDMPAMLFAFQTAWQLIWICIDLDLYSY